MTKNSCLAVGTCGAASGIGNGGNYADNEPGCLNATDCGNEFTSQCVWTPINTWAYVIDHGEFKIAYDGRHTSCMPWKDTSLKFYVEQAVSDKRKHFVTYDDPIILFQSQIAHIRAYS